MSQTFEQSTHEAAAANENVFRLDLPAWLRAPTNFLIWSAFVYQANAIWSKEIRHYSARTIGEVLRHHTVLSDTGEDYKLNDWLWPDLARLYMLVYPDRAGFFELRGRRAA